MFVKFTRNNIEDFYKCNKQLITKYKFNELKKLVNKTNWYRDLKLNNKTFEELIIRFVKRYHNEEQTQIKLKESIIKNCENYLFVLTKYIETLALEEYYNID